MSKFIEFDFDDLFNFGKALTDASQKVPMYKTVLTKLANKVLRDVKARTPVKTGKLLAGWPDAIAVSDIVYTGDGYKVTIVNAVEYASWVEKGHYSYNQFGGPYVVRNRTVPYYAGPSADTFVYGVFFLKKTELSIENGMIETSIFEQEFEKFLNRNMGG